MHLGRIVILYTFSYGEKLVEMLDTARQTCQFTDGQFARCLAINETPTPITGVTYFARFSGTLSRPSHLTVLKGIVSNVRYKLLSSKGNHSHPTGKQKYIHHQNYTTLLLTGSILSNVIVK